MRIFTSLREANNEIERDLNEMGILIHPETYQDKHIANDKAFETKELQGYCYSITSHVDIRKDFETLGGNWAYVQQEILDRVNSEHLNPGNAYLHRKDVWEQFLHGGKFAYTYNERIRQQLRPIYRLLKEKPNTRQAVITLYDHHDDLKNSGGTARIPCSMYYQFLIRKIGSYKMLDCIYTMRSCDFYTHFIYDVAMTMELQSFLATMLSLVPGKFTHFIGSLHIYRKDFDKRGIF